MRRYTISELLSLGGNDLSLAGSEKGIGEKEFDDMVKQISRYAETRYKRSERAMERQGLPTSPAFITHYKTDRSFEYSEDMTLNEKKHLYRIARDFLRSKTSTLSGYRKYLAEVKERLGIKTGKKLSSKQWHDIWKAYNKIWSNKSIRSMAIATYGTSSRVQEIVADSIVNSETPEDLTEAITEKLTNQYNKEMEEEYDFDEFNETGTFFRAGSNR